MFIQTNVTQAYLSIKSGTSLKYIENFGAQLNHRKREFTYLLLVTCKLSQHSVSEESDELIAHSIASCSDTGGYRTIDDHALAPCWL
jgi:hypothetical protein